MQILKSLRWRIQAWHALILLVVVASFGGGLFLEARRSRFEQIDADLLSGARVLEGVLRAVPGGFLEGDMTAAVGNEFPPPTAPDRPPARRSATGRPPAAPGGARSARGKGRGGRRRPRVAKGRRPTTGRPPRGSPSPPARRPTGSSTPSVCRPTSRSGT